MSDPVSTIQLLRSYALYAMGIEGKLQLARLLLKNAFEIAKKKVPNYEDLLKMLRRDIADLDFIIDKKEEAIKELIDIGDGFRAGDYYMAEGRYEEALAVNKDFHANGRFENNLRLWKCSYLLERYEDVLMYYEQTINEQNPSHVAKNHARIIAISAVSTFNNFATEDDWNGFKIKYPKCALALQVKIGDLEAIRLTVKGLFLTKTTERLRQQLIPKPLYKFVPSPIESVSAEYKLAIQRINEGLEIEFPKGGPTAYSAIRDLATKNQKLVGSIISDTMGQSLVHRIILLFHRSSFIYHLDLMLTEFEKTHGTDLISFYRDTILSNSWSGVNERNEVSKSINDIIFAAEANARIDTGLPLRGQGWIGEAEMVRQLRNKFDPNEVITQYSPRWLQGMRFDAYIPHYKLAVEYQGQQHFQPVDHFGGEDAYLGTIIRDELKKMLAKNNGVNIEFILFDQDIEIETTRIAKEYKL